MALKHQALLIARIIPKGQTEAKYRCIAAVHHYQFLVGFAVLVNANRLIRLIKQPQNAMILREEIKTLHGKYGRKGETPELPIIPAPYAMFLLQSAHFTQMEDEHACGSNRCLYDPNMPSLEGDYRDGITVIDITDPEDPHCGFIDFIDTRTIRPADDYVRRYYLTNKLLNDPELDSRYEYIFAQFSNIKLTEPYMFVEAWPDEYSSSEKPALNEDTAQFFLPVPPLVQISLKPAVISAVENDASDVLDHFLSDQAMKHAIKQIIMEESSLHSKSVTLLSKILERDLESDPTAMIDLSNFAMLKSQQVIDILTPHHDSDIYSLNLSHNPNIVAETLVILLTKFTNIRRLILFDTGITCDDLVALLRSRPSLFYHLSALIHPALLDQADDDLPWASDYGHWTAKLGPGLRDDSVGITLPFFSPSQVVQTTISLFAASRGARGDQDYGFFISSPFFQAAYGAEYREEGKRAWNDRLVPICPQYNLCASLLRLHGWLFLWARPYIPFKALKKRDFNRNANNVYAWIRFNSKAVEDCTAIRDIEDPVERGRTAIEVLGEQLFEVYDLRGFLDACVAEGRPAIPEDLRKTAFECLEKWKTAGPDAARIQTFRPVTSTRSVLNFFKEALKQDLNWITNINNNALYIRRCTRY